MSCRISASCISTAVSSCCPKSWVRPHLGHVNNLWVSWVVLLELHHFVHFLYLFLLPVFRIPQLVQAQQMQLYYFPSLSLHFYSYWYFVQMFTASDSFPVQFIVSILYTLVCLHMFLFISLSLCCIIKSSSHIFIFHSSSASSYFKYFNTVLILMQG